jgi:hypothetical protein
MQNQKKKYFVLIIITVTFAVIRPASPSRSPHTFSFVPYKNGITFPPDSPLLPQQFASPNVDWLKTKVEHTQKALGFEIQKYDDALAPQKQVSLKLITNEPRTRLKGSM